MTQVLLSSAYLPPIWYFSKVFNYDSALVEQWCFYEKQTYFNRCSIATANGKMDLSIPVEKFRGKQCVKDVQISLHNNWQKLHWRAIKASYNSAPFFEYYEDDFAPFYEKKYQFLLDFNMDLFRLITILLGVETNLNLTENYIDYHENDFREIIHPKKSSYIDKTFADYSYYQVFSQKNGFIPNLSIIDLLFNMGNESRIVLKNTFIER
ncbi:MAG: WbqC family protein [Paludibacteraceae bacterium]|nr:WbqC family protein [Paludibacteraceae bacterium]MBO7724711.1 WbqC family protein [Paludibacteraceae bacterium]